MSSSSRLQNTCNTWTILLSMITHFRLFHSLCFQLDPRIIQPFLTECRETITKLDNQNMKAIKGLEDRLYALDQMIASCKKLVNEQKELAQVSKSHFYSL